MTGTMTMKRRTSSCSTFCSVRTGNDQQRNVRSAIALKRYLDLTLRGTRKNLADQGNRGKKGYPISPYTFDRPDVEKSVQRTLQTPDYSEDVPRPPNWFSEINNRVIKHSGEAPIFTENFLPSSKGEQNCRSRVQKETHSRPLSGISTKSAPVIINGEMYYRQNKKHTYLQASNRPASAKQDRLTRAAKLRNNHKSQSMSGVPSDNTKDELKRIKETKPRRHHLNKDLLPIPCHTNETSHSFIIGARYNCSHFMDSRSFSRLGLYVPRQNPLGTFLKSYKGDDAILDNTSESEALVGHTSVHTGGSVSKSRGLITQPLGIHNARVNPSRRMQPSLPAPHVRKVVKEAWLNARDENTNEQLQVTSRNSYDIHRIPKRGSMSRSPVPPHPSPKLVGAKPRKPSSSSNRSTSAHSKRSNKPSQRSKSSSTPPKPRHSVSEEHMPIATVVLSRQSEMLKDLHLPKQSSLPDPAVEDSGDVTRERTMEAAIPTAE